MFKMMPETKARTCECLIELSRCLSVAVIVIVWLFIFDAVWDTVWANTEINTELQTEIRYFRKTGEFENQTYHLNLSQAGKMDIFYADDSNTNTLTCTPFFRLDQHDDERSHMDLRELSYRHFAEKWILTVGLSKVFWGVAESYHLVDTINQTDLVEDPNEEEKLGQPMIDLSILSSRIGNIDLFYLPYFRLRTFPGEKGRLRTPYVVRGDDAVFEADEEQYHQDWALRWFKSMGIFDIGIAYFSGTQRDPRFLTDVTSTGQVELIPYYDLIDQWSLDLQATTSTCLWKLEALHRDSLHDAYYAAVAGFEKLWSSVGKSQIDVSLIAEYLYDERMKQAPHPYENDLFIGARIGFNSDAGTELLVGLYTDLDSNGKICVLEWDSRVFDNLTASLKIRFFENLEIDDPIWGYSQDDFAQFQFVYHF